MNRSKQNIKDIKQRGELTSILNTTISPARIGSLLMCKNKMSPFKNQHSLATKRNRQFILTNDLNLYMQLVSS